MKSWVTIAMALSLLAGCGPSDQNVASVRDRVKAGEYVEFSENGKSFCGPFVVWNDMRLNDKTERQRVIVQKQKSFIQAGWRTCYRVGEVISLSVFKDEAASAGGGMIRITSIGFVLLERLNGKIASENLTGSFFKATDNLDKYKAGLTRLMKPEMEGVVTVVNFEYISGTATDEDAVKKADREESETEAYNETTADGESIGKCNNWTDFDIKPEVLDAIKSGELRSWYRLGTQNCLKQGAEVGIRLSRDLTAPQVIKVRVKKVKSFRMKFIAPKFFELNGYKYEALKALIDADNKAKPSEFMTVTDFEYIGEVNP